MQSERGRNTGPRQRVVRQGESTGKRAIEQSRLRLVCIVAFFAFCFLSISFRLIEVASAGKPDNRAFAAVPVGQDETMSDEEREEQALADLVKEPNQLRGDIVDRNGNLIATSLSTASLFANPRIMKSKDEAAKKLAKVFPRLGVKEIGSKLNRDASFVWIKRNLTPIEQQQVNTLGIPGLYFQPEERRIYPQGALLAHVLGYVGVDNKGLAGIEKFFDKRLRDEDKNKDALKLSIDLRLQNIVNEELSRGMREYRAIGATGIVMDIHNGELLAMSNLPDFDPHRPAAAKDEERFNRATLGTYEMGSTFKTFTSAMALDYGVLSMKDGYDTSNPIKIGGFTISDSHPKNRFLTVPEIYAYSSNIGTVREIMDVGISRQKAFLEKLGMFKPVDIEMPEKGSPRIPSAWREINSYTISYGHGMAVTPLHLVRGIAAVVGDGHLKNLTLVKGGNDGKENGDQVVKQSTTEQVRRLMRLVVQYGTGSKADVAGYRVGGKTGTAEKVGAHGGYNAHAKMALFVSTFPVDEPKYVMLIMFDEPQPTKATFGYATGGWNAAPVAGRIISRMGPLYGMAPEFNVAKDDASKYWTAKESYTAPAPRVTPPAPARNFDEIIHAVSY